MNEMSNTRCAVDLPYPDTAHILGIKEQGKMLSMAYAGTVSEMTAVTQYTYQHIILEAGYPEISDMLACISMTEMKHLVILGTIMENCGVEPRFADVSTGRERYWSGTYPNYIRDVQSLLLEDIAGEQMAIREYERLIARLRDPAITAVIRRIILDEQLHIELFSSMYADLVEMNNRKE